MSDNKRRTSLIAVCRGVIGIVLIVFTAVFFFFKDSLPKFIFIILGPVFQTAMMFFLGLFTVVLAVFALFEIRSGEGTVGPPLV